MMEVNAFNKHCLKESADDVNLTISTSLYSLLYSPASVVVEFLLWHRSGQDKTKASHLTIMTDCN